MAKWKGGFKVSRARYLSKLEDEKLRREEESWGELDEECIACDVPSVEDQVITRESIRKAAKVLTDKEKITMDGNFLGFTMEEIGGALGVTAARVGTIRDRGRREINRLRRSELI